jgi:hypothetical protein
MRRSYTHFSVHFGQKSGVVCIDLVFLVGIWLVGISQYLQHQIKTGGKLGWYVPFSIINWREPPFTLKVCK